MPTLYFITGPSAVGKTELSLEWAEKNNAEIISCDSLLFYRGMDIGTAKPSKAEQQRIPHHGIDLVPASIQYSISDYLELAKNTVTSITENGKKVLVCGGSGFYLKSFFYPVVDEIVPDPKTRAYVRELELTRGLKGMVEKLQAVNPGDTLEIELQNPRRVANALIRCLASGKPLAEIKEAFDRLPKPYQEFEKRLVHLTRGKEDLLQRVTERTQSMLSQGLIDEVKKLLATDIEKNPSAANAIGYRETIAFLRDNNQTLSQLEEEIIKNTMHLIKKQGTWCRNQIPVNQTVVLDRSKAFRHQQLFSTESLS